MKNDENSRQVYYLKTFMSDDLAKQIEWSKSQLNSNSHVEHNFNLYQGEIIYFQYYEYKRNKFQKNLALVLDDSHDYENDAIVCPLIPLIDLKDSRLGINIGKIQCISTKYDFIAVIPAIKRVNKNYIKVNKTLTGTWIDNNFVYKIVSAYRNMLSNIITKQCKIEERAYC